MTLGRDFFFSECFVEIVRHFFGPSLPRVEKFWQNFEKSKNLRQNILCPAVYISKQQDILLHGEKACHLTIEVMYCYVLCNLFQQAKYTWQEQEDF